MPRMHPKTFNAAAKHLFRYLHDSRRLQANPITSQLFRTSPNISESPHDARQTLSELHALVIQAAKHCRDEGISAGKSERARRQFAIINLQYFEGHSIREVAHLLGLSVKHCYRERAEICQRIALYLYQRSQPANVVGTRDEEGFYFLLDRLLERDAGAPRAALRACQYLEGVADSPQEKIDALQSAIALSLILGDYSSAEAGYVRAVRLYEEHFLALPSELQGAAQASINVAAWHLANHRGRNDQALRAAEFAVKHLEHPPMRRTPYAQKFWVEAHFNLAVTLWARGNLAGAYDALNHAASRIDRVSLTSALRFRVEASLWKLRNYLLLTMATWGTSEMRLNGLRTAFNQAYELGSLSEAIDALISITECHVFARRDEQALHSAHAAVMLSKKIDNPVMQMETSIDVAVRLLSTRFWRQVKLLFPLEDGAVKVNDYHQRVLDYATALQALRLGDFEKAWRYSNVSNNDGWTMVALRSQLVGAASAHLLGLEHVAREAAESAVYTAERFGAAPLLRDAYRVAADVLGDERFGTGAREMTRILAA
jgi:hypothetical protein